MFWECEKVASASHISQFGYNKCCYGGRIILRPPSEYPQYIKELYEDAHFIDNIRAYNQMFRMTSLGANNDKSINNGKGPYVFRISGQLYHWIGSLCPEEGQSPRTAHSRFQIPLNLEDESICRIKNSQLAELLWQTDLIIWDEAPMNDRRCFEALDHSLKDIYDRPNTFFGGKSIMLRGDFRQNLLVKKKASKPEILDASITSSYLWPKFKVYTLLENMWLRQLETTKVERIYIQNFSSCLLNVGDGTMVVPDETDPKNTFDTANGNTKGFAKKKAIVCPKNEDADMINAEILALVNHQKHIYLSFDEAVPHGNNGGETKLLYPAEYLNSLNFAGFPPHRLEMKVGAPIILLRNLNISGSLCNRTRLIVTQLLSKVIEARIITGTQISEKVFLPRIPLINRDLQLPFIFKRKQFPIKLSYAMTINKSQGQSLERICIFLPQPVFAHGQFDIILPFLIWGDTAETFDMDEYNKWKNPLSSSSLLPGQPKNTKMVNTRTDTDLTMAVQNALQALLPQIREEIREEFRNALAWWKAYKQARGGDAWLVTVTWADFKKLFFLQFFPRAEQERLKREAAAGTEEEQAKNFQ
nr:DNA helicase [Tanacetum cinerariifolium]